MSVISKTHCEEQYLIDKSHGCVAIRSCFFCGSLCNYMGTAALGATPVGRTRSRSERDHLCIVFACVLTLILILNPQFSKAAIPRFKNITLYIELVVYNSAYYRILGLIHEISMSYIMFVALLYFSLSIDWLSGIQARLNCTFVTNLITHRHTRCLYWVPCLQKKCSIFCFICCTGLTLSS